MKTFRARALIIATHTALLGAPAFGGELEALRAQNEMLIKMLVERGVLTQANADTLKQQAQAAAAPAGEAAAKPSDKAVRVQYVPEIVKQELREQIRQEVMTQARNEHWAAPEQVPEWLDRVKVGGDVRVRWQHDSFAPDNAPPAFQQVNGNNVNNTTVSRDRLRVRARLGVDAKLSDKVLAGIQLGTGNLIDPVSTNSTLGNNFNRFTVGVDRAFIRYAPVNWAAVVGGRFANPWYSTDLVWNENLNFDGLVAGLTPKISEQVSAFMTAGAFPVQDIEPNPAVSIKSKWLFGYQGGLKLNLADKSNATLAVGVYDYRRVEGIANPDLNSHTTDLSSPLSRQQGNSLFLIDNPANSQFALASKFKELNITAGVDIARYDPVHVMLSADYVRNIGFDHDEIMARTGLDLEAKNKGYQAKLAVGMPEMRRLGDWQGSVAYRYLERDAVLDAYTDSDFHLGGTDAKGFVLSGSYGIDKNAWLRLRWLSSGQISGLPLSIHSMQLDMNARF